MKRMFCLIGLLLVAGLSLVFAQTVAEHIQAGDEAYAKFDDATARTHYEEAVKLDPNSYEALWKTSRACLDVADRMKPKTKAEEDQQMKLWLTSEDYAKKAVKINPNDTWGHFFYSAAMGMHTLKLSKKQQVAMSKQIKAEIDKAIQLDPKNDLAWHALGRWQTTMAEIGGASRFFGSILFGSIPKGSFDEAVKYFKTAIEIKPNYSNHHLELGRTYLAMKKKDLAAQEFQIAVDSPILTSKCADYKQEAADELAKLKKK